MALNVVTGIGPRVGSSFVMQQCKANGLKVHGDKFMNGILPKEGNPGGYYDVNPYSIRNIKDGVAKIWPVSLGSVEVPISKLVILERKDREQQYKSIAKQMEREPFNFADLTPEFITKAAEAWLNHWLQSQDNLIVRSYYTEDLDDSIDEIVSFLGE